MPAANMNDLTPLWKLGSYDLERVKKSNKNVGYILVGNWVCFEDRDKKERIPSCCKNNKWQEILERESLIKYLESERGLVEQREFFRKECNKCLKKWQITSFFLYTSVMDVE
ncbi:13852_t:CDS:2, partial [Entrophospora sp. SA101]